MYSGSFQEPRCKLTGFEVKKRDGLARISTYLTKEGTLELPCAIDTGTLFPDLLQRRLSNVPLSAPAEFANRYKYKGGGQPVEIYPAAIPHVSPGDCVMVPSWSTTLSNPRDYVSWLVSMKTRIPPDTAWYIPAVALPSNVHLLCYSGFDLFDFTAVDLRTTQHLFCLPEGEFPATFLNDGICDCRGCRESDLGLHNRLALKRELVLIRHFIAEQQLREFVDGRVRMQASHVAILRHLDYNGAFFEERIPVVRNARLGAMSGDALFRPEIRRFAERVVERYIPSEGPVAVLLPCSAKKPYSLSQSHHKFISAIAGRAVELIVTSPLGLVPRDLEQVYPAAHYDIPVTGYWDKEEISITAGILNRFLSRHHFTRLIAHLEGGALEAAQMAAGLSGIELTCTGCGHTVSREALACLDDALSGERKVTYDPVRGILSWQFGIAVDTTGMTIRWKRPNLSVRKGTIHLFSLNPGTGLLRPTFAGWNHIPRVYRVIIDDFPVRGDILVPGVIAADPMIREGDEVLVEGPHALATGRAAMGATEMHSSAHGVAVRVRKVLKD